MWTRARIKQEAKNSFKRFGYWMPFLVAFLTNLIYNIDKERSAFFIAC